MSVRINIEIGHEASLRTKRTQEGFTHDWEVFVRGCDGSDIQNYIEKVVFHLHETFPKPKRVVKEPPFTVKESGYAGFNLPIDICLKNKDEPKKIKFNYDLNLQPSGPPIIKVQKEKYVFHNLSDEFKQRLLKGGGSIVSSISSSQDSSDAKLKSEEKPQLLNKPKLGGSDAIKKHKIKDSSSFQSFQGLFGTPIQKTSKISPEPKPVSKDNSAKSNSSSTSSKDKSSDKDRIKNKIPIKDKERDRIKDKSDDRKNKDKERSKDKNKERDRSKEKSSKRDKSPRPRSPSPKRILSPKRPASPKRPPSPPPKHKESDKRTDPSSKEKDKKSDDLKSEKKYKKDKRDKERDYSENKYKDLNKNDFKEHKSKESRPKESIKELSPKIEKKEKPKEKEVPKEPIKDSEVISDKNKEKSEEKKEKHKHKKKDKEKRERKEEKSYKSEKKSEKNIQNNLLKTETSKEVPKEIKPSIFASPKHEPEQKKYTKPLNTLFSEIENDNSNSSISSKEEFNEPPVLEKIKPEPGIPEPVKKIIEPERVKPKKDKTKKKEKKAEKEDKKRKRKSEIKVEDEPEAKVPKEEPVTESDQNTSQAKEIDKENQENPEDYMKILRELQHKIMTLQDNSELQKVVQLIAETGRYEVSARTFDFDLCLLERSTVKRLQEFFSIPS